jgi:hypothetical protein
MDKKPQEENGIDSNKTEFISSYTHTRSRTTLARESFAVLITRLLHNVDSNIGRHVTLAECL